MTKIKDLEREYLEATLSWLDVRLKRDVQRWQLAGQNPSDRFRGLYVSNVDAVALSERKVGTHWGSGVKLPEKEIKDFNKEEKEALKYIETIEKNANSQGIRLRLKMLKEIFGLSEFEWWAFIVCLAPSMDLRYERIYSYLQDDVTRIHASVDLLLNLLAQEGFARLDYLKHFDRQSPLRYYRLLLPVEEPGKLSSGLRQAFSASPGVADWLLGSYSPSVALGEWADFMSYSEEQDEDAMDIFDLDKIPHPDIFTHVKPFLSMYGDDFLQQELTARQLAEGLKRPLLKIKLLPNENIDTALEKLYPAVRDARMLKALLYIQGCDVFIDQDGCLKHKCFESLRLIEDTVLFSSKVPFKFSARMPNNDHPLMLVPFDQLTTDERVELWNMLLEGVTENLPTEEMRILAGQFSLTSGQIVAAASSAMSKALQEGRMIKMIDLFEAARFHSGHHLAELAHKIEPRYGWEDLVLPESPTEMLLELVSMVKSRPLVLEDWGLADKLTAGKGVSALFSGDPGTGKTLAAQIIAKKLGIDLYRIDLSTVVSKYVGETEKNLEKIFSEASESNAILFFDEADAIFGKRSEVKDAHDRYANIEVGYLLQRMENYDGVAILATNLQANLDDAFTRRLQFIIHFPFPDEEHRLKIWDILMPPGLPIEENLNLELMASRFKMAGGNIRNIIVSAAFLAADNGGKVTMPFLMHGAKREIQKMGKIVKESDFAL